MKASAAPADRAVDPVDAARAHEYQLLATLLSAPPSKKLLSAIARLEGDETPLGRAHAALAEAASQRRRELRSSANISTCSSASGAAKSCPTPPTT